MSILDLSRQHRWALLNKLNGRCPVCGGEPDMAAKKSKLCPKHLAYQREAMRKRKGGVSRVFIRPEQWLKMDWRLKDHVIAAMTQMAEKTVAKWRKQVIQIKKERKEAAQAERYRRKARSVIWHKRREEWLAKKAAEAAAESEL